MNGQFVMMMLVITGATFLLAALVLVGERIHRLVDAIAESNGGDSA